MNANFPALARCLFFYTVIAGILLFPGRSISAEIMDMRSLYELGWGDNLCAITFDDGPGRHTERLLNILQQKKIPATFFVVGENIPYNKSTIQRMAKEGHEVAIHTQTHPNLRKRDKAAQQEEIASVQRQLQELGVEPRWLRPPFGNYDKQTINIVEELGLNLILWSIDSKDWSSPLCYEKLKPQVTGQKLRGVFLFHDIHANTIAAIPTVLDRLAADGCRFVTVSSFIAGARQASKQPAEDEHGKNVSPVPNGNPTGKVAEKSEPATAETAEAQQK